MGKNPLIVQKNLKMFTCMQSHMHTCICTCTGLAPAPAPEHAPAHTQSTLNT